MKLGWRIVIVVAALGTGMYLSRKPWEVYREQKAKASAVTLEMNKAEKEREKMMDEKASVDSALGREKAIRDAGWTKPGETPIKPTK